MADFVTDYITNAPKDQQTDLMSLRAMIESALPMAQVTIDSGFPVWTVKGKWVAGFATRKKGPMFYLMIGKILQKHRKELGKLLSGKSCVDYHENKSLSREALNALIKDMLNEAAIDA